MRTGEALTVSVREVVGLVTVTVAEAVSTIAAKIGEKIELVAVARFDGTTHSYLHQRSKDLPPQVGVLVEFVGADEAAADTAN